MSAELDKTQTHVLEVEVSAADRIHNDLHKSIKAAEAKVGKLMASVTEQDGIIKVGNVDVNLKDAFPLVLGDLRKLGSLGLIDKSGNVKAADPDSMAQLLLHLVQKVKATVTELELDKVPLNKIKRVFLFVTKTLKEDDDLNPTKSGS